MHRLDSFVMCRLVQHALPPAPRQFVAAVIRPIVGQPVPGFETGRRVVEAAHDSGEKIGIGLGREPRREVAGPVCRRAFRRSPGTWKRANR